MNQKQSFLAEAQAALANYDIREPDICFLGHSDNLTFRVETPDGIISLLRLHRPVINYWEGIRQLPEVIASELAWLEALGLEGDFPVQRPLHTRDGQLVAKIEMNGTPVACTLMTWETGEHFSPVSLDAPIQVERFGELVARMNDFAGGWIPPAGFIRPQYNYDHFRRIFARLLRGVDPGMFPEEVYWLLRSTTQEILREIEAYSLAPEQWGMIHADLHVGNFLVHPLTGQIIPIDFSFCGFGHYLFDVSVCLAGGLKPELRPSFLTGYQRIHPLNDSEMRVIDAYVLAGKFSYFAYQIDNPTERTWMLRRIPEVAMKECRAFLQGGSIL